MIPDILTSCHINWRIAQRSIGIMNPLVHVGPYPQATVTLVMQADALAPLASPKGMERVRAMEAL